MKTQTLLKTITVAGALAATLTLSACDMHISFGQEGQGQEQEGQPAQSEDAQNPEPNTTQAAEEPTSDSHSSSISTSDSAAEGSTSNGTTGSGGSTDSGGSAADEGYQGPRIGEEGVELDQDGNGKIPADVLEKDIKHAYAKQGTTVDTVDCFADLRIMAHRGSQNCTITAAGKKHYGTVKITSASQSGIGYSLEFPNI